MRVEEQNVAVVRAYIEAVEKLDVEGASAFIDAGIVQTEYPNKLYDNGQVRSCEDMLRELPRAAQVQPGDTMVAHICMVFTLRDGRIVAQNNYDCYEDFAAAA